MARTRLPVVPGTGALRADGSRPRIVPADVTGRFTRARRLLAVVLLAFAGSLPWIKINGEPALFVDIGARRLFAFGGSFNAQDTPLLFFFLTGIGLSLFVVTTLFGRLWCGWTCPQTVVMDAIFRPIERWIEGSRDARLRRDAGPWTAARALRFTARHAVFALAAVALAHGVLAFFVTAPGVLQMVGTAPTYHPEAFWWVVGMSAVIYVDFAWFREQLCLVICPYGRLQAALVDDDTVTIGYDEVRGEPRGRAGTVKGDCLACDRCVVVCPTGIDIRDGAQLDCTACAACVDACDAVMDRAHRARGLVRYDSPNGFAGSRRRVLRPRILFYAGLGIVGGLVATLIAGGRHSDAELSVQRLPGAPYQLEGDRVRNSFDAHVVSKRATAGRYTLTVDAPAGAEVVQPVRDLVVEGMGAAHAPLFVTVRRDYPGPHPTVRVSARREGSAEVISAEIAILGTSR
jgi:cytochrome c oxidase accessory protein FixG